MKYNHAINALDMPARILRLPVDKRGYPVPRFVKYVNGEPDFRVADQEFMISILTTKRCWICGEQLGRYLVFLIGPMCAINRVTAEPPAHLDCARFACKACPFLTQPKRPRNEHDLPGHIPAAGLAITRNPGVTLLWVTESYRPFRPKHGNAGVLLSLGEPTRVEWWAHGREATHEEIMASFDSGLPILRKMAEDEGASAVEEFNRAHALALTLVPLQVPV